MKSVVFLLVFLATLHNAASLHMGAGDKRPTDKVIFDLGMNTGIDTERWLKQGYKVIAVEANPVVAGSTAAKLIESKALQQGRLKILNVGIENSQASGKTLEFWIPEVVNKEGVYSPAIENGLRKFGQGKPTSSTSMEDSLTKFSAGENLTAIEKLNVGASGVGSFDKYSACRVGGGCHAIKIQTMTCSDLLKEEGVPHYLKVDIEGRDIGCLKNIMANRCGSSQLPKYVSFENYGLDTFATYFEQTGNGDWKGLLEKMHERGYTKWKRARTWTDEYTKHLGQMGADSAFGEDLLDLEMDREWKPTSLFADKLGCDVNCSMAGFCKGYCDMHAKLDEAVSDQNCNP